MAERGRKRERHRRTVAARIRRIGNRTTVGREFSARLASGTGCRDAPREPALRSLVRRMSAISLVCLSWPLHAQIAVRKQGYVPFSDAPINYLSDTLTDPVAKLQQRISRGEVKLDYEPAHGYLKSVLDALDIPASSQTLVFSKTSFQFRKISPETPRALYFNDDVYVGQVHDGKALEMVSFDPMQGAIFYLLDERKSEQPVFQRAELDCTQCHVANSTRGVPGVLLRSIYPNP